MTTALATLLKSKSGIRLDVGCGGNKHEGFVGIDYRPLKGVDVVHNLEVFPWPLPDECALMAVSTHVVEHIDPHAGVFINFMDEVWRVLKPGGEFAIVTPYAGSIGYFQDPTHCNPCNEVTFRYFDPLDHVTDGALYGIYKPKPWQIKFNAFSKEGNLEVILIKRKEDQSYGA